MHPVLLALLITGPAVEVELVRARRAPRSKRVASSPTNLFVDRALHQHAAAGRAGLAGVLDDGVDDHRQPPSRGRRPRTRSAATCRRARARTGMWLRRRRLLDQRADLGRAGERDEVDARMARQRRAGLFAIARCTTLIDAGRECRPRAPARPAAAIDEARLLGRLQHAALPAASDARERAAEHLRRVVPRDDVAGDAARLAQDHHLVAGEERDGLAVDLVGGAAEELEIARRRRRCRRAPASSACRCRAPRAAPAPPGWSRIARPSSISSRPRSIAGVRPQSPSKARRAAATAASMSSAPPRAIWPITWPSLGQIISIASLEAGRTHRPSM